jgi:SAM-dependent methyltransferase
MDIYNSGEYLKNNPQWADDEANFKFNEIERLLTPHLAAITSTYDLRILDIGCGSAGISCRLTNSLSSLSHSLNVEVDALDLSYKASEMAATHYGSIKNLTINQGTISDVSRNDYDLTTCIDVIEHIYDYETFLTEIKKRTKFVLFNVPIEINLLAIFRPNVFKSSYMKYGHVNFYNHEYFVFLLERLGFKIIETKYSEAFKNIFKTKRAYIIYPFRVLLGHVSRKLTASLFGGFSLMVLAAVDKRK